MDMKQSMVLYSLRHFIVEKSIANIIDVFLLHFGCFLFKLRLGQRIGLRRHNLFQTRPKCGRTKKSPLLLRLEGGRISR